MEKELEVDGKGMTRSLLGIFPCRMKIRIPALVEIIRWRTSLILMEVIDYKNITANIWNFNNFSVYVVDFEIA